MATAESSVKGDGHVKEKSAGLADSPARLEAAARLDDPDRNEKGQFKPGCKPGPGNPYNRELARIKKLLTSLMTDEEVLQVGRAVLEQAKQGNIAAARIMLQWNNLQKVDPDQVDLDEWKRRQETMGSLKQAPAMISRPDVDLPALAREGRLAATSDWGRTDTDPRDGKKTRPVGSAPVCDAATTAIVAGPETVSKAVKR